VYPPLEAANGRSRQRAAVEARARRGGSRRRIDNTQPATANTVATTVMTTRMTKISPSEGSAIFPANLGIRCACDNSTRGFMKAHTHYLWFNTKRRQEIIDITDEVATQVETSTVREGLVLVSAMHISASVFVNDHESGYGKTS